MSINEGWGGEHTEVVGEVDEVHVGKVGEVLVEAKALVPAIVSKQQQGPLVRLTRIPSVCENENEDQG